MTWEELIEKFKDTNIDLTNVSKKKTQKEFETIGLTPDMLFIQSIDGLIRNYIDNKIFKHVNIDFETHPLEAIAYKKVYENMPDIKKEFISLFKTEDELIDFFRKNKL